MTAVTATTNGGGLATIDVLVLAGGLGTRLEGMLGDAPKVLAPVGGRPFLDHLLAWLAQSGARRIVLGLGHRAEKVQAHLRANPPRDLSVVTTIEPRPLGTAGAIRHCARLLQTDPILVMNGDTWLDADLAQFVAAFRASGRAGAVLCAEIEDGGRYGRVEVAPDATVSRFVEKDPRASGSMLINAGVYLFSRPMLEIINGSDGPSLERDILQKLPPGTLYAHRAEGAKFVDIGTPESLGRAAAIIGKSDSTPT